MPTLESSPAYPTASDHTTCRSEELALRERLLSNDPEAWRSFDAKYGRLVASAISKVVGRFGSRGTSEDVQEIQGFFALEILANEKAKLRAFDPARGIRLTTWISMLASHTAYDFLRKRRREPACEGDAEADYLAADYPDPHTLVELRERSRLVDELLEGFSAKDRQFFELYFDHELDPTEIAERMGINVKTVYTKRHKIQLRLEALLGLKAPLAA